MKKNAKKALSNGFEKEKISSEWQMCGQKCLVDVILEENGQCK